MSEGISYILNSIDVEFLISFVSILQPLILLLLASFIEKDLDLSIGISEDNPTYL